MVAIAQSSISRTSETTRTQAAVQQLEARVHGELVRPGDAGYDETRRF